MGRFIDRTGQTFGRLTVLRRTDDYVYGSRRHVRWLCKCSCGNMRIVDVTNLIRGSVQSCGCLQRERTHLSKKRYNRYEFHNTYVCGYTQKNEPFVFDIDQFDLLAAHCWYLDAKKGFVTTRLPNGQLETMHRLIMTAAPHQIVDHINHDTSDNRSCNLRIVTRAENAYNMRLRSSNSSGVTGVYWDARRRKWVARICINYKEHYLGRFDRIEDAIVARKTAEEKYFGEYSYDNSMAAVPRITLPQQLPASAQSPKLATF